MGLKITIVGLGQTGAAIGAALKKTSADLVLVGHDRDHDAARRAQKAGYVDRTDWNLIAACDGADLVILSIPLDGIRATLQAMGSELKKGCVVTDTASVKAPVLVWAQEALPTHVSFVGGHPIMKRRGDAAQPPAEIFSGITWCLSAASNVLPEAIQRVSDLVEAVGAHPYFVDAAEHDGLVAAVEQMPTVMAAALQLIATASPSRREMQRLSGTHFVDTTQPLSHDAGKLAQACLANGDNLQRWLDVLISQLMDVRAQVSGGDREAINRMFDQAIKMHDSWSTSAPAEGAPVDYSAFSTSRMMMGDLFQPRNPPDEGSHTGEAGPGKAAPRR